MNQAIVNENDYVSATDGKDLVVLIAEDDKGNYVLIRKSLELAGVLNRVIHFGNGEELLDFLYSHIKTGDITGKTYVLVLDINMPKVNGIEVLSSIKGHSILNSIPVIVNSSCEDQETIRLCYSLGCIDYKVKPVKAEDIIVALKRIGLTLSMS
jgi:CheY-like chemotaxis protein